MFNTIVRIMDIDKIEQSGVWYQNIELAPGIWTDPDNPQAYNPAERWAHIESHLPT